MEIPGLPKAGAVSVGMGIVPELPACHWFLGEGLAQRPAGKTPDWDNTWQEKGVIESGPLCPSLPVS